MWSEACEMLARAERLHREFFRPGGSGVQRAGMGAAGRHAGDRARGARAGRAAGRQSRPRRGRHRWQRSRVLRNPRAAAGDATAIIHRLELPQGRFERRVRLPAGRYSAVQPRGCRRLPGDHLAESGGRSVAEIKSGSSSGRQSDAAERAGARRLRRAARCICRHCRRTR